MKYKAQSDVVFTPRPDLLLHPNIPKPLHGVNPRSIKGQEWWDAERKKAYASTGYCCAACGVPRSKAKLHKWLEAHEIYDIDYVNGTAKLKEIVPLCHYCHSYIHSGYLRVRYAKGEISREDYQAILAHGKQLTRDLKKPKKVSICAAWQDWRLHFGGAEYKPIHKNYYEWHYYYYRYYPQEAFEDLMDEEEEDCYLNA